MSSEWLTHQDLFEDLDELSDFFIKPFNDANIESDPSSGLQGKRISVTGVRGRGRDLDNDSDDDCDLGYFGRGTSSYGRRPPSNIDDKLINELQQELRTVCGNTDSNIYLEEYLKNKQKKVNNDPVKHVRKTTYSYKPMNLLDDKNLPLSLNEDVTDMCDVIREKSTLNIEAEEFSPINNCSPKNKPICVNVDKKQSISPIQSRDINLFSEDKTNENLALSVSYLKENSSACINPSNLKSETKYVNGTIEHSDAHLNKKKPIYPYSDIIHSIVSPNTSNLVNAKISTNENITESKVKSEKKKMKKKYRDITNEIKFPKRDEFFDGKVHSISNSVSKLNPYAPSFVMKFGDNSSENCNINCKNQFPAL